MLIFALSPNTASARTLDHRGCEALLHTSLALPRRAGGRSLVRLETRRRATREAGKNTKTDELDELSTKAAFLGEHKGGSACDNQRRASATRRRFSKVREDRRMGVFSPAEEERDGALVFCLG